MDVFDLFHNSHEALRAPKVRMIRHDLESFSQHSASSTLIGGHEGILGHPVLITMDYVLTTNLERKKLHKRKINSCIDKWHINFI